VPGLLRRSRATLPPGNVISVVFATPQKILSQGLPLIATYFAHTPEVLGIVMLPLLFYHPCELLAAGLLCSVPWLRSPKLDSPL
jgi:predicted Na+-dependent transporter